MLDFLSKFVFRRPASGKASVPTASNSAVVQNVEVKKTQVLNERAATLENIARLKNDEAALVGLLLSCDFADGRFKAAEHIHSQSALEQVKAAMLNVDKRVVKLMQSRLDALAQAKLQEQLAQLCLEEASHLATQSQLMPNQVIELDKRRAAIAAFPDHLKAQFEQSRAQIDDKMLAQTALQRRVLDVLNQVSKSAQNEAVDTDYDQQLQQLQQWQDELDSCQNQPESVSLPKNMLADGAQKLQQQRARLQALQQERKNDDRLTALNAATEAPVTTQANMSSEAAEAVTEPTGTLPPSAPTKEKVRAPKAAAGPSLSNSEIVAAIEGLTEALEQGSIQNARKFDRDLRNVDARTAGLTPAQKDQLIQARNELGYLQGWAKWGGDVSRDELINAVLELPAQSLAPNELAKKVAAMRERWRAMEASSGAANKDLWERFDSACKTAYEPAALFFKEQDELRKANLVTAENMLADVRSNVERLLDGTPDWKAIAQFCMQTQQNWKKLGHVDRKHRARLDADVEASLQLLRQPLEQRRQQEIVSRETLIADVTALDPLQRSATDQLRALQERWQAQASSVPLRRKDEQALWDKFRAACDHLFAQRKQASGEADAQRKENLAIKLELCATLEQASSGSDLNLQQLLQQSAATWKSTGAVPRAEETSTEQRYQSAVLKVKQHIQMAYDQQRQVNKTLCLNKVSVCQKLEAMLVSGEAEAFAQQTQEYTLAWQQLGQLPSALNNALQQRFDAVLTALSANDQRYRTVLENNVADFDAALLQLEIISGIESPAELSRERLQMQVEVLQTSLKRGADANANNGILQRLLTVPVLLDTARMQRLEKVLAASVAL